MVERYHHSVDAFPDFGRTLPFGSGATILCNYIDLQLKNISTQPLQIKLWLTDTCLKGQILSDRPAEVKFHLAEKNHYFIKKGIKYFRFNEIYREVYKMGVKIKEEKLFTNFAPVVYPVDEQYIKDRNYDLITL